ncbi:hypothetical protein ABZ281_40125 [Streptomyces sp. NPDC006265]|uniref:hypothetical protein n=1 Tax=Streptomyces sp. NPDC006265 TaxID=3156740 RepID=UPI0033BDAA18
MTGRTLPAAALGTGPPDVLGVGGVLVRAKSASFATLSAGGPPHAGTVPAPAAPA